VTCDYLDRRGLVWGLVAVAVVLALTFVGSDGLVWFDAARVGYLFGVIFAAFGIAYRYAVLLQHFVDGRARNAAALPALIGSQLLAQGFIRRRSHARWLAHQFVFWGACLPRSSRSP
jgi:hypothetical protein